MAPMARFASARPALAGLDEVEVGAAEVEVTAAALAVVVAATVADLRKWKRDHTSASNHPRVESGKDEPLGA